MGALPFERRKPKILVRDNVKIFKFKPRSAKELLDGGIVNLDKPAPSFSRAAGRKVKGILEVWKAGHAGTLDPAVTGVLPIFLAKATKLSGILTNAGKEYHCWLRIHDDVSDAKVRSAIKKFTGKIQQLPPRISAVKRVVREREIYYVRWIKRERNTIEVIIGCQAGTYIRKWCHDIGEYIGTGAHMAKLIRTKAGPFKLKDTVNLDKVKTNYSTYLKSKEDKMIQQIIQPIESAIDFLPKVWVDDDVLPRIVHGSPVFAPGILQVEDDIKKGDLVVCMTTKNRLASVGYAELTSKQMIKAKTGMAVKTDVVML
jgi:H/ACA ribonucleoprotein complex subunit 4